ncbi:hypothetical protein CN404_21210 [Bacillus thuringiensis]|uniref:IS3 family transposase n=1 Tax=Bacillus thuringiensis TaxID=1428 RepID=UPI000BF87C9D|nr:hypothetical protein CN404_21210 [Bacillus thuringiensis]
MTHISRVSPVPYKAKCFYLYSFKTADEVKEAVHHYIYVYNQQEFPKNETISVHTDIELRLFHFIY